MNNTLFRTAATGIGYIVLAIILAGLLTQIIIATGEAFKK